MDDCPSVSLRISPINVSLSQTKPIDLGCESAENWQVPSTSTIAIVITTQTIS